MEKIINRFSFLFVVLFSLVAARPCCAALPNAPLVQRVTRENVIGFQTYLATLQRCSVPMCPATGPTKILMDAQFHPDSPFHQQLVGAIINSLGHHGYYTPQELDRAYITALPEIQRIGRERFSQILQHALTAEATEDSLQAAARDVQILHAFGLAYEADSALEIAQAAQKSMDIAKKGAAFLGKYPSLESLQDVHVSILTRRAHKLYLSLPAHAQLAKHRPEGGNVEIAKHLNLSLSCAPATSPVFAKNMQHIMVALLKRTTRLYERLSVMSVMKNLDRQILARELTVIVDLVIAYNEAAMMGSIRTAILDEFTGTEWGTLTSDAHALARRLSAALENFPTKNHELLGPSLHCFVNAGFCAAVCRYATQAI